MATIVPLWLNNGMRGRADKSSDTYIRVNRRTGKAYAVTLNSQTVCAAVLMGLILLLERCEETGLTRLRAFMAGVMTGLILNLEFVTGGVLGIAVFVFVLTLVSPRRIENALMYAVGAGLLVRLHRAESQPVVG